ncbi:hypothetical protein DVH24_037607 [Malus domestica]|uniref:Uncharacterized protein n=1 Tax=Malus domestica TaxID=3750 RepID=A0A498J1W1_MALDO|nr:hypothetical protein DVH24_037607 [Malus domestica]
MIQMVTLNYGLTHYSDSAAQMLLLNPVTGALHSEATTEFSAFAASADATFSMPVDLREILPSTLKQAARSRAGEHKKTRNRRQICGSVSNDVSSRESNPIMDDPLGSSRLSSQKQNREGLVGIQRGQYCATMESNPECDGDRVGM